MAKCQVCGVQYAGQDLNRHIESHRVFPLKWYPLSYLISKHPSFDSGSNNAARSLVEEVAELRRLHPGTLFQLLPFYFDMDQGEQETCHALRSVLAVALDNGVFVNPKGLWVEWHSGWSRPLGPGWVDQHPEREEGQEKFWHRLMP